MCEQGTTQPRIIVNGGQASLVDVRDRGFALGDGVFETIRVEGGKAFAWSHHLRRLQRGTQALGFLAPEEQTLINEARCAIGSSGDGTLKLTVTRGPGPRGYAPPTEATPTRVAAFYPGLPTPPSHQLSLRWCATRLASQPQLAGIKHLNRLEQVLARSEWSDDATDEGLMQAVDGRVIECTSANVFCVRNGQLVTPELVDCGVAGVVRSVVLEQARAADLGVEVRSLQPEEIVSADEVFITNSIKRVAGVAQLGQSRFGAPGPVTVDLARRIQAWA